MMRAALLLVASMCLAVSASAQSQPQTQPQTLTLQQAMAYAADHYPTVRAAIEQVRAAEAGVGVARASYLPRLDGVWQANRGTVRNVFGQLLPQSVIPAMSGPVLLTPPGGSVWGSAAGALASWEPIDFGLRHAAIAAAGAVVTRARAGEALTRLAVQRAVAEAFLAAVAAERSAVSAQADFERRDVLSRATHALVDSQLRPGADASRAAAERAAAYIRLVQTRAAHMVAETQLARLLGMDLAPMAIDPAGLLERLPAGDAVGTPAANHPLAQVQQAVMDETRAQQQVLSKTNLPRFYAQSSLFARGSGAAPDGVLDGGAGGLALDRTNWAAGFQVVVPNVFDFVPLRARKAAAAATARAQTALFDESVLAITADRRSAALMIEAARTVAAGTPLQLTAARQAEMQARARYDAGLASLVEVADAQSLLAQAETQDAIARIDVWRAALAVAAAQGDFAPFISRLP